MTTRKTKSITLQPDVSISVATTSPPQTGQGRADSPTLVFLHFWGGSSRTWSYVTSHLSSASPTLAIDFRGWGSSTGQSEPNAYGISHLAGDVVAVIRHLKVHSFVLIGHSMGAKVAQFIAGSVASRSLNLTDIRESLKGLVLVSPAPPTPLVLPAQMREQQIHAYDNAKRAGFVAQNVLTKIELSQEALELLVDDMLKGNEWARAAWPTYAMGEDIWDQARLIKVPCLVIAAENDVVEPVERVKSEIVERLEWVEFVVVEDSGHISPVEKPETVAGHILKFLQSLHL